ncbi:EAL domain-containing protein, partial [Streptomyces caniscabiei]|uniref:EAL domain-containing protein n=1 Tax=Streptomyces caniscabiei TaxID=2746961 RepID=UPI0038F70E12
IRPTRLELELTEYILLESSEHSLASLRSLRERGPRLVLDDFGTGYSSLQYLRNFAFDKIKIDRSYIGDVGRDRNALSLVQGIVSM